MTTLQRALDYTGSNWIAVSCPFHQDSNASAGYLPSSEAFNCFGCGKKFKGKASIMKALFDDLNSSDDSVSVGEELDLGLLFDSPSQSESSKTGVAPSTPQTPSFSELLDAVGIKAGTVVTPVSSFGVEERVTSNNLKQYLAAMNPANIYYKLYSWLDQRKISPETIDRFGGTFIREEGRFNNHLAFSYNGGKNLVARNFGEVTKQIGRFYCSPNKRLFNLEEVYKTDTVILVEGLSDFLAMIEMGFDNTTSGFGVEVNKKMLYPLRGKTVFILFDTDYAGYEGARKVSEMLRDLQAIPIILEIPKSFPGKDPDKVDVGECWEIYGQLFRDWLSSAIQKFAKFDEDQVKSFIKNELPPTLYFSTGLEEFDLNLGGGFATGLHVIGGEPESGKSSFLTQVMDVALNQGKRVLFCTYELPRQQMYARLASRYTKEASWQDIERDPTVLQGLELRAGKALYLLSNHLKIVSNWDIHHILAAADNFDIIMVDYLQRMPSIGKGERREAIDYNVSRLSDLSTTKGKIIVMVSSIPRASYGEAGNNRAIFKESGMIEYVAQSAFIIRRMENSKASVSFVKNTRGVTHTTTFLSIDGRHQRLTQSSVMDILGE